MYYLTDFCNTGYHLVILESFLKRSYLAHVIDLLRSDEHWPNSGGRWGRLAMKRTTCTRNATIWWVGYMQDFEQHLSSPDDAEKYIIW